MTKIIKKVNIPVILISFTGQQMKKIEKKIIKLHFQNTDLERRIILKSKVISEIKEEIGAAIQPPRKNELILIDFLCHLQGLFHHLCPCFGNKRITVNRCLIHIRQIQLRNRNVGRRLINMRQFNHNVFFGG